MIDKTVKDHEVLLKIACLLDEEEWDAATLEEIAQILREHGYTICDVPV